MASKEAELEYKTKQLERQMKGMQRRVEVVNAKFETLTNKLERRIRDLELKTAAQSGVPQRQIANIYELSPGRVSQIVKKVG